MNFSWKISYFFFKLKSFWSCFLHKDVFGNEFEIVMMISKFWELFSLIPAVRLTEVNMWQCWFVWNSEKSFWNKDTSRKICFARFIAKKHLCLMEIFQGHIKKTFYLYFLWGITHSIDIHVVLIIFYVFGTPYTCLSYRFSSSYVIPTYWMAGSSRTLILLRKNWSISHTEKITMVTETSFWLKSRGRNLLTASSLRFARNKLLSQQVMATTNCCFSYEKELSFVS